MTEELSPEEQAELQKLLGGTAPIPDEKHNVHTFLSKVLITNDTTKVGNLNEQEIGMLRNPVRAFKSIALFSEKIMKNKELENYFLQESEIGTSTSLSRKATLLNAATTSIRKMADITPTRENNSGWFKKKESHQEQGI